MVKKFLLCFISIALLVSGALTLSSCSKPPEYAEIEERFIELVEASYEINKVLFGIGLPTDERIYDPWDNMKTYGRVDENGEPKLGKDGKQLIGYYCYFEDSEYGDLLAYRDGATAKTVYLSVSKTQIEGKQLVFTHPEKDLYYYATDYLPPDGVRYYSDKDPTNYDYVSVESEFLSVDQIKMAAEKVYSPEYLEALYESLFTGVAVPEEAQGLAGLSARYIEYMNAENGDTTAVLMQSNTFEPLVTETRVFDFSTATMVKPSNKKLVNIEVETYLPSAPEDRLTVRVTLALVNGQWFLDSGTY